MLLDRLSENRRLTAALAAVTLEGALIYALLFGLAVTIPVDSVRTIRLFSIAPPPPRVPPPVPRRLTHRRPSGAASPPNLRSRSTEIVAPVVPPIVPPTVIAAPVAGIGKDPSAGNADVRGPGTGSGGQGTGTGSGSGGDGDGDGDGGFSPPRWLRGSLRDSDYPAAAGEAGAGGTVSVRFTVETNGRVGRCLVTRSSGNAELDETTCRLIEQRYRYRPSLDPYGRPVRSVVVENHTWETQDEPPEDEDARRRGRF